MRSIDDEDGELPIAPMGSAKVAPAAAMPARGRSLDDDEEVSVVAPATPAAPTASVLSPEAAQAAQEAVARAKVQAQVATSAAVERAGHLVQAVRHAFGRVTLRQRVMVLAIVGVLAVSVPVGYGARYWWIHRPVTVEAPVAAPVAPAPEGPAAREAVPPPTTASTAKAPEPAIAERPAVVNPPVAVVVAAPTQVPVKPLAVPVPAAAAPAPVPVEKARATSTPAAKPKPKPKAGARDGAQERKAWEREQSEKLDAFFSKKAGGSP